MTRFGSASQIAGASSTIVWYAVVKYFRLSASVVDASALSTSASNVAFLYDP
jgi:hypothetical protein